MQVIVPKIFKKKRFWIGFILLFIGALIFDVTMAAFIMVKSLSSGQWNSMLLGLGLFYVAINLYKSYLPKPDQKQYTWFGRGVLLIIAVTTFMDYGYFKMLYFLATVFIFTRFVRWTINAFMKVNKRTVRFS